MINSKVDTLWHTILTNKKKYFLTFFSLKCISRLSQAVLHVNTVQQASWRYEKYEFATRNAISRCFREMKAGS